MPLVTIAYIGLLILVAATPGLLFLDNLVVAGAIQLYVAVSMLIIAAGLRPGEARHIFKLIRVPAALAAMPLLWMLMQLLPIAFGGLSRSIWDSAATALQTPLLASITVDPGLTLIAVSRLATIAGIAFIASVVSIDRERARKLLLLLASAAVAISLVLLASQLGAFSSQDETSADGTNATMMTASIAGIVLFTACVTMAIERYERHQEPRPFSSQLLIPLGVPIVGLLVCSSTFIVGHTSHAIFAAACGLATVAIVYFVRRLGFGPRAGLAIGCLAIIAASAIVWAKANPTAGDVSLRYVADASADVVTLDNRIFAAVGLTGSGAGTYPGVSTIYGAEGSLERPATFAAQIGIELGRPALWIIVGFACTLVFMLARSAFNRGRDYFYPLAGAGVTVAMVLDCFTNATLANPAISLLVAVTLGLGFGQSVGRNL
jgi:hypothetical protein